MGCKAICGAQKSSENTSKEKSGIQIIIVYPDNPTQPYKTTYLQSDGKEKVQLMEVMNNLTWGKGKEQPSIFDGNFITIFNPQTDRHHYFCHRLLDIVIENPQNPYQGKMWVPYINDKKKDWDDLIENNFEVNTNNTKITWKFEFYSEKKDIDFVKLSKQQSTALSIGEINVALQ